MEAVGVTDGRYKKALSYDEKWIVYSLYGVIENWEVLNEAGRMCYEMGSQIQWIKWLELLIWVCTRALRPALRQDG